MFAFIAYLLNLIPLTLYAIIIATAIFMLLNENKNLKYFFAWVALVALHFIIMNLIPLITVYANTKHFVLPSIPTIIFMIIWLIYYAIFVVATYLLYSKNVQRASWIGAWLLLFFVVYEWINFAKALFLRV